MKDFEERLTELEQSIAKLTQKMAENAGNDTKSSTAKETSLNDLKEGTYQNVDKILNEKQDVLVMGYFKNDNVTSRFSLCSSVDKIKEIDAFEAEKLLSVLANQDRIEIIKLLLNHSATSTEIMEKCGFETTGKFYHHINMLMNLNIIKKVSDGLYVLDAKRAGYVIPILACVGYISVNNN